MVAKPLKRERERERDEETRWCDKDEYIISIIKEYINRFYFLSSFCQWLWWSFIDSKCVLHSSRWQYSSSLFSPRPSDWSSTIMPRRSRRPVAASSHPPSLMMLLSLFLVLFFDSFLEIYVLRMANIVYVEGC